jgi:hypothetical protein
MPRLFLSSVIIAGIYCRTTTVSFRRITNGGMSKANTFQLQRVNFAGASTFL